jgi:RNA polymerase sigma factor (sigma-70 family)
MVGQAKASPILQLIRRMVEDVRVRHLPDQDLLQRFHAQQDQAAFHALLRRHGPMVLEVCRAVLGNEADAEDAFQATFLILARKAGSIRKTASLASWLHGVAYRTALKARAQSTAREKHEARLPARQASEPDDLSWREVRQVLHEEVSGLPERYRAPLVLCYLEGATQEAAAFQLNVAKSTLRERLERGRTLLRARLVRHGLGPTALLIAAAWPAANASACLPTSVVSSTIKAASLFAAGQAAAPGVISVKVAALTEGVLKAMFLTKIKIATAVLLLLGALGISVSGLTHETLAADPAASNSARADRDDGNLKETVLALEKRIWEAHTKQDVNTFKNLLADDFAATDGSGRSYGKKDVLGWVASFRVLDPVMKNARVVVLNATSAIVTYEIRYRVGSPGGQELETAMPAQATSGWAIRDGTWRCVYSESSFLDKDGIRAKATKPTKPDQRWKTADTWEIMPIRFKDELGLSDTKLEVATDKDKPPITRLKVWLPAPADTDPTLGNVAEPLSVQLARINAANATYTIEQAIPIVKQYIELDVKRLNLAKDPKSMRKALEGLENSVQMLKELLTVDAPAEKKP